jgi:hypothetical protein
LTTAFATKKRTCINTDGGNGVETGCRSRFRVRENCGGEYTGNHTLTCLFLFPSCVFGLGTIIDGVHHSGKNGSGRTFLFFAYGRNMYFIADWGNASFAKEQGMRDCVLITTRLE